MPAAPEADGRSQLQTWDVLIRAHGDEIHRFLRHLIGQAAEDLCHETFLRCIQSEPLGLSPGSARALLYRIARNLAIDHARRRKLQRTRVVPHTSRSIGGVSSRLDERIDHRELLKQVDVFVAGLPPKQRLAIILRLYQGLSYPEIASILEASEQSARANVYQALRKIRARFAASWEEIK